MWIELRAVDPVEGLTHVGMLAPAMGLFEPSATDKFLLAPVVAEKLRLRQSTPADPAGAVLLPTLTELRIDLRRNRRANPRQAI